MQKPVRLLRLLKILFCVPATCVLGQGTFVYDQQSSTNEGPFPYGSGPTVQSQIPSAGQSFVPNLFGVDFIELNFNDADPNDGFGATLHLNLRSTSIMGPILGTTDPVTMANGFTGVATFFFPQTVSLSPGTTYYFELNLDSGGPWDVDIYSYYYPQGTAYRHGLPLDGSEYWFREGLYVIPEPSPIPLMAVGLGVLAAFARRGKSESRRT